jgi:putative tryptophan/tyrosine transport system substrate-binding protein
MTALARIAGLLLLACITGAMGQSAPQRIGYLSLQSVASEKSRIEGFRQGLAEAGYEEGKRVVVQYRHADGNPDRLPGLVAELLDSKVEVILAVNEAVIRAVHKLAPAMPIVFPLGGDPVKSGLVKSMSRPGGSITGFTSLTDELGRKRLAIMAEVVPAMRRVAVIWNPQSAYHQSALDDLKRAAPSLRLQLQPIEVISLEDFDKAFGDILKIRAEGIFLLPSELFHARRKQLAKFATEHRLPTMLFAGEWVEDGGLLSYAPHVPDLFRRSAGYVVQILKGAKPAEMPVQQPAKFELLVNQRTAKAIGVKIPQSVLMHADRVVQ